MGEEGDGHRWEGFEATKSTAHSRNRKKAGVAGVGHGEQFCEMKLVGPAGGRS